MAFLRAAAAQPDSKRPPNEALRAYQTAAVLAQKSGDAHLESLALAHVQEKSGDPAGAARSYQRALILDPKKTEDSRSEGADWFDYGQFLRR